MASSWAEGLSSLIPSDAIFNYFGFSTIESDECEGALGFNLIRNLLRRTPEDAEDTFWLMAYLIGAECNSDEILEGYNLWEDVLDVITWNKSTILPDISSPSGWENKDDPETGILTAFVSFEE